MKRWLLDHGLYTTVMEWCCIFRGHKRTIVQTDIGQYVHCARCWKSWH